MKQVSSGIVFNSPINITVIKYCISVLFDKKTIQIESEQEAAILLSSFDIDESKICIILEQDKLKAEEAIKTRFFYLLLVPRENKKTNDFYFYILEYWIAFLLEKTEKITNKLETFQLIKRKIILEPKELHITTVIKLLFNIKIQKQTVKTYDNRFIKSLLDKSGGFEIIKHVAVRNPGNKEASLILYFSEYRHPIHAFFLKNLHLF